MGTWQYTKPDLEILIDELRNFSALIEQKVQTAPEPAPEKPVKKNPLRCKQMKAVNSE